MVDNLESFYQSYPCFTDWFESKKNAVCIPLVKYFGYIDLDSTFLHELRHSIECDKQRGVGVTYITNRHYDLLNEIRTEKLAIRDSTNKKFSHFNPSGESVLSGSLYEQLFFLTGDLFERNVDLLNKNAEKNKMLIFRG